MSQKTRTANVKVVYANNQEYNGTIDIHQGMQMIQNIMQGQKSNQGLPIKDFTISMDSQTS